jgi:aryl-alcohol dehydrogenase-like predicted oxidoreductase
MIAPAKMTAPASSRTNHIRRACEASLRRLQTDHIDLYQMHHVDRATPWEEIWQAMEQLVREGKISYVGSSNFAAWDVAFAQCAASARHFMGLTSEQSLYNLAVRTVELVLIPALRCLGIGLIPYSRLHAGLLAGVLETATEGGIFDDSTQQRIEAHRNQLEAYEGLCGDLGAKPADVAPAWLLNPVVSTTIVGATTIEELRSDLDGLTVQLDAEVLERLDRIWPGPREARRRTPGKADPDTCHGPLDRLKRQQAATREPFGTNGPNLPAHSRPWRAVKHAPWQPLQKNSHASSRPTDQKVGVRILSGSARRVSRRTLSGGRRLAGR